METANTHHGRTSRSMSTTSQAENNSTERGIGEPRVCGSTHTTGITTATIIGAEETIFSSHVQRTLCYTTTGLTDIQLILILPVNVGTEETIHGRLFLFRKG